MKLGVCNLDQIAQVKLGFKSLQNRFFYVSKATIKQYGIEKKYLKPIFQLGDLREYKPTAEPTKWVFYCKVKEPDLHGTGALRYLRAMEKRPAVEKKQTGKKHQTIGEALQAQTSKHGTWYMPKAQLHQMNIWLRKAFGSVYSPFIFDKPVAVDQRCNYVLPLEGVDWEVLAAVLTSSLFALSAESFGSASLGGGALELATTMIRGLRVVDVRDLKDAAARNDLILLTHHVWKTKPFDWSGEGRPPNEVQELDKWFLTQMGTAVTLDRLYADLAATLRFRLTVARDKDVQTKQGQQIDIDIVASGIAETVRPLLESKSFPESFIDNGVETMPVDVSHASKLEIECRPMMDQALVSITNGLTDVLFEAQFPRSVAQVIVKALLMGRRNFSFPTETASAERALEELSKWLSKVRQKIATGCGMSAVGTSYEEEVHDAVLEMLHLDKNVFSPEFYGELRIHT